MNRISYNILVVMITALFASSAAAECVDRDGDGYGMNDGRACRARRVKRNAVAPDSSQLAIVSISTTNIGQRSATININFNKSARSRIKFGTTQVLNQSGPYRGFLSKANHTETLTNLKPDTVYYYQVTGKYRRETVKSDIKQFRTSKKTGPKTTTTTIPVTTTTISTTTTTTTKPSTLTPLRRSFPGYGGEALDDTSVTGVYFMTNTNASGPGSLAAAPSNTYIVPLVAGKIVSDTSIRLPQNNVRFLGSLAPGHLSINGSTVFNSGQLVKFDGSNALWEHFSIRASDVPSSFRGDSSHSTFEVANNNTGVVLANLSLHFSDDDSGSVWYTTSDVTFYRLLVAHATNRHDAGGNPNYGLMVGGGSSNITMFQNVMMTAGRSPHIQNADFTQSVNNVVYHAGTGSTSNQIYAIYAPARTVHVNFHDNLDIRFDTRSSNVWTGQSSPTLLSVYTDNNQWRNCAGVYKDMGFHSSVPDTGTVVGSAHTMPSLPAITDLATLEAFLLPRVGYFSYRDALDNDVMSYISSCSAPPVFSSASDYFPNPWLTGPTGSPMTFWDESSPDGLSDAAKGVFGIAPGTNLLSPNDGRWEAVVDFHSGGRLSASMQ